MRKKTDASTFPRGDLRTGCNRCRARVEAPMQEANLLDTAKIHSYTAVKAQKLLSQAVVALLPLAPNLHALRPNNRFRLLLELQARRDLQSRRDLE